MRLLFQSASSKCTLILLVCRFFVVARGSASLLLSIDGRGHFQTHEEPLNDVQALSILRVHYEIYKWHFEIPKWHFELSIKVRIKCVQSAYRPSLRFWFPKWAIRTHWCQPIGVYKTRIKHGNESSYQSALNCI
jgi:hypothetical protein